MGTLEVLLIVLVAATIMALLLLVALRARRVAPATPPAGPVHPQAPVYKQHSEHVEYYRPQEKKADPEAAPPVAIKRDPRKEPLPHCPLCNAAIGFEDKVCPKCKHTLKGA